MKIKQIHFYRYGLFLDVKFDLTSDGLQVLYGENEAGKSTMMQFIREILFGFSGKSPGIGENGGVFGGALTVEFPERGHVRIERTGNKGHGSVKIHYPNGETGGEEGLREWLPGLDEAMFRAIFCFDLDGLQGLEKVKAEELNDYLFHAGMTGDYSIRQLEKNLLKKQEELFKRQGRNPSLNKDLAELEQLEKDVAVWQRNNESYRELVERSREMDERLVEIREERESLARKMREIEKKKVLIPYVREQRELQSHLAEWAGNGMETFPEDGIQRYEKWQSQAVALEAELAELEAKRDVEFEKASKIEIKQDWMKLRDPLRREREREPFVISQRSELAAAEQVVRMEREELAALMEQLGPLWTEETVLAADTGFAAKETLKKHAEALVLGRQRWEMLKEEQARSERLLQESERELEALRKERLTETERDEIERKVDISGVGIAGRGSDNQKRWGSSLAFYGGTAFTAALVVWLIFNGQWVAGVVTAVFAGVLAIYLLKYAKAVGVNTGRREFANDQDSMKEAERASVLLEKDRQIQGTESVLADRLVQREKAFVEIVEQTETVRQELKKIDSQMADWKKKNRFPLETEPDQLFEVCQRVEEIKTRIRNRNRAEAQCRVINKENEERIEQIKGWCREFGISYDNEASALARMSERLEEQEKLERKRQQLEEGVSAYEEQITSLKVKIGRFRQECEDLLKQAGCVDEEAFRSKAKAWAEWKENERKLAEVEARMKALGAGAEERKAAAEVIELDVDLDEEIRQMEVEMEKLDEEVHDLYEQVATVQEKRKKLEEGGTYAELLHRFELKKSEFREDARRWAVYRMAEHLLQKAKEEYRNRRLPAVIEAASQLFTRMTEGRYIAVFAPQEEGIGVERKDGARFKPEQLSRGTAEQLYLALRLALARIYQAPSPYPFIMDDVLVNFDSFRTKQAVETIRETATQHQMLFFTCHEHLLPSFRDEEIVSVRKDRALL